MTNNCLLDGCTFYFVSTEFGINIPWQAVAVVVNIMSIDFFSTI